MIGLVNIKDPSSEYAVDNVAANRGASTKDSSIAHFLSELLPVLLKLAVLAASRLHLGAGLAYGKLHVAVFG